MNEWPDASRLTDELDRRAATFEPAYGWDAIQARLDDPSPTTDVAEVHLIEPDAHRNRRSNTPFKYALIAASILLVSVFGIRALLNDDSGVRTDIADQAPLPTTSPEPTVVLAPRTFTPVESCSTIGLSPTPSTFLVEASRGDAVVVGGAAGIELANQAGTGPSSSVFLGDLAPADLAASTFTPSTGEQASAIFIDTRSVSGGQELSSLTLAGIDSTCAPTAPVTFATGLNASVLSVDMACGQLPGRGFHGIVLFDAPTPPTGDCISNRPVFLLGDYAASDPSVLAWAELQGCINPQSQASTGDPIVTRWQQCESTLVHVQTTGDSAWDVDDIEGQSVKEFVSSIFELVS